MEVYYYCYLFETGEKKYYVYALSKVLAIAEYLEDNELSELPKNCVISRILD